MSLMNFIYGLMGFILSMVMLKKREVFVDMLGDQEWMSRIGGPYMFVIYLSIIICFWSFAMMFGLTEHALEPILRMLMPWVFKDGAGPV